MMKQVSVFVENQVGSLAAVTKLLGENQINIRAISGYDTPDFNILRVIVDDSAMAASLLKENGFTVKVTSVLGIVLVDTPGYLSQILSLFMQEDLSINYIYSCILNDSKKPILVLNASDLDTAKGICEKNGIQVICE